VVAVIVVLQTNKSAYGQSRIFPTLALSKAKGSCQERPQARAAIPYNNSMKPIPRQVTSSGLCFAWGKKRCIDGLQAGGLSRDRSAGEKEI